MAINVDGETSEPYLLEEWFLILGKPEGDRHLKKIHLLWGTTKTKRAYV